MQYKLASSTWDEKEIQSIQKVIDSQNFSMGVEVEEYEKEFAEYFGSKFAVMTSSGSTANLLMIASLFFSKDKSRQLKRGDEIIVPSVSWSTTYFPLQQYGLKVKFIDIDKDTLNFNLNDLEQAITHKTKAILAVNLLGNPNDFKKIQSIIEGKDILLLEDNCESMGAIIENKYAGTYGLMGTFSSFFSHHIATMEGGCILTDDEEIHHILLCLRAHGWTRNLPNSNHITGTKSDNAFDESFKFVLPGYNVRPIEMSGAIGREQLKKLSKFIQIRRENAKIFQDLFNEHKNFLIQKEFGKSSWFGFSMILKEESGIKREDVVSLLGENDIDCRPIVTGNFLKNKSVLEYFDYEIFGNHINAELVEHNGFFVGNHQINLSAEIHHLYSVLKTI
tara:strand:- start:4003 stop:5178 length:1176 start_codon:yes stop_codon:yes gene_type:complete